MKKVTLLGVVLILLAFSVAPVMAAGNGHGNGQSNGQGNGHGIGVSSGQSNNGGISDQTKSHDQDRDRDRDQIRLGFPGKGVNRTAMGISNSMRMRTPFYLQGTITGIEGTGEITRTLTISLTHGNAQVKQFFTSGMTVTVSGSTQIFKITQGDESTESTERNTSSTMDEDEDTGNRVPISMGELATGQRVAIHGNVVDGVFNATLITVYIGMPLGETVETP